MISRQSTKRATVQKLRQGRFHTEQDALAVEEPLEIRLVTGEAGRRKNESISVTMRTPGHDFELAVGFLFSEGIIQSVDDLAQLSPTPIAEEAKPNCNIVDVHLRPGLQLDTARLLRHFYATSSCGVCGKASLEALRVRGCSPLPPGRPLIHAETVRDLPEKLRQAQSIFERTGGLHAAALFDAQGNLVCLREDVGRHNAVDKVVGQQLLTQELPLSDFLLMVSGRTSFEIVQKALMGAVPVVAAVSAPSSLAVSLAAEFGMTLLGFVRGEDFNIYTGTERILK
ncbi:MAG: formate dehydrogenase accessory sulfurtransferase FdhD [Candidatus Binatia bacterium]